MAVQPGVEERVARVEATLEQMNIRLGNVEKDLRALFRWTLGLLFTVWVTLGGLLLGLYFAP